MNANELYRAGKLQAALDAQLLEVKANPGDMNRRLFLFELASFGGDLDRARRQLDLVHYDKPELEQAVSLYRMCLDAEQARRAFFAGGPPPNFFGEQPAHVGQRLEALTCLRSGRPADAARLVQEANDAGPALKGTLNEQPFEGMRDGDDLFGTVLEVFSQGRYFWVPLELVDSLQSNAPQFPRDLLWMPGRIVARNEAAGDVFLPTVYPDSHGHSDEAIQLGRSTDWPETEGLVRGIGGRSFLAGENVVALLEVRQLEFE